MGNRAVPAGQCLFEIGRDRIDVSPRSSSISHSSASTSQRRAISLKLRFSSGDPMLSAKARALAAAFLSSVTIWVIP
jgi:hypothetical protein